MRVAETVVLRTGDLVVNRIPDQVCRAAQAQFPPDRGLVKFHGFHRHVKLGGDLFARMPLGEQLQHLPLPVR